MLIEEFYRLGRALLESDPNPRRLLELVTDVGEQTVKNFYRNVFIVVLPSNAEDDVRVQYHVLGDAQEDGDFVVSADQAVGVPITLPVGGNTLEAQGCYRVPAYPCYDRHFRGAREPGQTRWVHGFQNSRDDVREFLVGRLGKTQGLAVPPDLLDRIADAVHKTIKGMTLREKNTLGVLVLADCGPEGFYSLQPETSEQRVGVTADGKSIVPNYARILDAILDARVDEGRGKGARQGHCSFCGQEGQLVSAYCKSWPWALPTWTAPLPHGGDADSLIESIALTPASYRALTVGACVFDKLSRPLAREVIPEIFSPADTRGGKEQSQRRKLSDLPAVQGSALLYSVREDLLENVAARSVYARGVWGLLDKTTDEAAEADRYIGAVVGFKAALPRQLQHDYRLALVYFSGSPSRGDVHLRSIIQDVLPGTVTDLRRVALDAARQGVTLLGQVLPKLPDKRRAYLESCYRSVPYLLARAYGGGYLWQQMETVLHRRSLGARRVVANAAGRMDSLTPRWPDSYFDLLDEVAFLLHMRAFIEQVNAEVARQPNEDNFMPTREWKQLVNEYRLQPVENMTFATMAELGFACGLLVRRFSGWYRAVLGNDKDYLRDRVLTFGAGLRPHDVWKRAINGICDTSARYQELHKRFELGQLNFYQTKEERREHVGDFQRRLSVVQSELERSKNKFDRERDDFMTGFWSGYGLLDYDSKRRPSAAGAGDPETTNA
jgi:hypothetical protein